MSILTSILIITVILLIQSFIGRLIPNVPSALITIVLGAAASYLIPDYFVQFEPEIFMVCLIAPLLFNDGMHFSQKDLWKHQGQILSMSIGLAIGTIIVLSLLIRAMIPEMPVLMAVLLGSVLSPTDVSSIQPVLERRKLPNAFLPILEGENILNDDAGIICFDIVLAAMLTDTVSGSRMILEGIRIAVGGIMLGALVGYLIAHICLLLRKWGSESKHMFLTVQIIAPFAVYIIAESVHVSGFFAVVAAGFVSGFYSDRFRRSTTDLWMKSENIWSLLRFVLNGFVFVMMGFLLPETLRSTNYTAEVPYPLLFALIVAATATALLLRFLWVYIFCPLEIKGSLEGMSEIRYCALNALCGVRGPITYALAFSVPLLVGDSGRTPYRDTILLLSAGTILLTLLAANIFIPLLTSPKESVQRRGMDTKSAMLDIYEKTFDFLNSKRGEEDDAVIDEVTRILEEKWLHAMSFTGRRPVKEIMDTALRIAHATEIAEFTRMLESGELSEHFQEIFFLPKERKAGARAFLDTFLRRRPVAVIRREYEFSGFRQVRILKDQGYDIEDIIEFVEMEKKLYRAVVQALEQQLNQESEYEFRFYISAYKTRIRLLEDLLPEDEEFNEQVSSVILEAVAFERIHAQKMLECESIDSPTLRELFARINYEEIVFLEHDHNEHMAER